MGHHVENEVAGGGILANKLLWLCVGIGVFVLIAFVLPTPQSVLDVMEQEKLTDNARTVGDYIRAGFTSLAKKHALIGDIRGQGLWVGVELVRDRDSREPAETEAKREVNAMKDRGVLMGRIGQFDNVLKMRPPLPFQREHADMLLSNLDAVLGEL